MIAYVYESVETATNRFHGSGGVLIVTDRDPLEAWLSHLKSWVDPDHEGTWALDYWVETVANGGGLPEPTITYPISGPGIVMEERVFVFPNAGCC